MTTYDYKKMFKVSRLFGEVIGSLKVYLTITKHNYPDNGIYGENEKYTNELIHRLNSLELYDYTIEEYLEYQEHIKNIRKEYIYIGDYSFDNNTQFLWKRIYLSNEETINFDSHRDLLEYVNNNFVNEVKFVEEK